MKTNNTKRIKHFVYKFIFVIDSVSKFQKILMFPLVVLVFITCIDIVARSVFNSPIIWAYDVETQLFASVITLGWGYSLLKGSHVRITSLPDKFLSERGKIILMLFNYFVFLFPFVIVLFIYGLDYAWDSWQVREVSTITPWQPYVYPIKATIPLAALLLFLQSISEVLKLIIKLIEGDLNGN